MDLLNEQQTTFIEERLEEEGLKYLPLKEEFLDHLCCMVEENMALGYTFSQSVEMTFALFPKGELQHIEQETFSQTNQKKLIMKLFSIFVLSVLMSIPTYFGTFDQEPPSIAPLQGAIKITSGFGKRFHPIHKEEKMHKGIDFRAPIGTPVVATSDGEIIKAAYLKTGYGKHIMIQHDDHFKTMYGQLSEINVKEGQRVKKGEVIGAVGSSGASTGPHLHYEVIKDGAHQDPEQYLQP